MARHRRGRVTRNVMVGEAVNVVQADTIHGGVHFHAAPAVRSAYLEQVRHIAPDDLRDRDRELAELAAWCVRPEPQPWYAWWRAPAWSGKSALLSWFVLHPPAGVRVVSFFVTAALSHQSDKAAFAEVIVEQLAEVLGEPLPALLTEATRDAHLRDLLKRAAVACERRGQRLVLVVDGLDEDRGVVAGPDGYSIAALLPASPVGGMRVVASGRPHPPIPPDVPPGHPLRDPSIVRELSRSEHAGVVRADAERELKLLLHGSPAERELVGFVAAAGGGLNAADLVELTGRSRVEVEDLLGSVAGRTFTRRASGWGPRNAPPVYLLGHERLQSEAVLRLGEAALAGYRQRLHAWADGYRERGWPVGTPEYLLRDYFPLLQVTGAQDRMVACGLDRSRHDRMFDPIAALAEVTTAQDILSAADEPDLLPLLRLAIHHSELSGHRIAVPDTLPAAWVYLGQPGRAEALVRCITSPLGRSEASVALVEAMAATGDLDRAEAVARAVPDPEGRSKALAVLLGREPAGDDALVTAAEAAARAVTSPYRQVVAMTELAQTMAASGYRSRAGDLIADAETRAGDDPESISNPHALVAKAWAVIGDTARTTAILRSIADDYHRSDVLAVLTRAVAAAGDLRRAEALARRITRPDYLVRALAALVTEAAATGRDARAAAFAAEAEACARSLAGLPRANALAVLAEAVAATNDGTRTAALVTEADAVAHSIVGGYDQVWALSCLVGALAAVGDLAGVEQLAESITDQTRSPHTLARLAGDLAAAGLTGRAEALARSIDNDEYVRPRTMAALVKQVVAAGDTARAEALATDAESGARARFASPYQHGLLTTLAEVLAVAGDLTRAEALARAITAPLGQVRALATLMTVASAAGDRPRAGRLAVEAESLARSVADPGEQATALAVLIEALAAIGDHTRAAALVTGAEALARSVTGMDDRMRALAALIKAVAATGDHARAKAIAHTMPDRCDGVRGLSALVEAVAVAGDTARAESIARSADNGFSLVVALVALLKVVAVTGDGARAEALATEAETAARAIDSPLAGPGALAIVAEGLAVAGAVDRAETLLRSLEFTVSFSGPSEHERALIALTEAVAQTGDLVRAETLARTVATRPHHDSLAAVAAYCTPREARRIILPALRRGGSRDAAIRLLTPAEASSVADDFLRPAR